MESLSSCRSSSFTSPLILPPLASAPPKSPRTLLCYCSVSPDPWSLSDGNPDRPKPRSKNPKNPLSDDNARRIIKAKARYLSVLRRNQGPRVQTPRWIKRSPEQMVQYLQDDRNGHLYGKHVLAAIKTVRALSARGEGEYDMRAVMASFVGKLSFREMCVVLKEQKGWRQVRDFFAWMKLQLSYRPSVVVYTIVLRIYGQVGKIKLAEDTFLEMLEAGCEPDEVACGTMLCTYARWGRHKAMRSFYSAVEERGVVPSVAVFNFMLSSLQKKSLHRNVIDLWRKMLDKGVTPNAFTYTVVISSFAKDGHGDEAFKCFYEMKNAGFVPEEVTYSLLISLSNKNGNFEEAVCLYEDMRSRGIVPSNYTCASLLTLYYKRGDYPKALSLFSEMDKYKIAVDEVIYGLLIRIYGKLGLHEEAEKTFKEVEQLGLLRDEKTYLTMAQVHLSSGNPAKALSVVELMKAKEVLFSRFAYIVLLQCYVMEEDLDSAEATFQALSKSGSCDAGSCNDMLNLYIKLGLMDMAQHFISQMRKDQIDFDDELVKAILRFYCRRGMLRDAELFIEDIVATGSFENNKFVQTFYTIMHRESMEQKIAPDSSLNCHHLDLLAVELILTLYMASTNCQKMEELLRSLLESAGGLSVASKLINGFVKGGDATSAENLTRKIVKLCCITDDEAITSLIGQCTENKNLKNAEEIFAGAIATSSGTSLLNSMINAYVKCGKLEDAYLLYVKAVERGHDLSAVASSIIVNALTNAGKHQEAESIIHKSFEDNFELDTVAYNTFIKAMLEAGKLNFAANIYDRMLSMGVSPSIQTINTMISVYARGQKLAKAVQMFNTAHTWGLLLDEKAYMNLISFYGKAGERQEASLLFSKMQEEGIKPGTVSYNIMMNMYATAGCSHEVEALFKSMQEEGCLPDPSTYLSLIRAYTESSKISEAEEILRSMKRKGISPSCAHLNVLLSAFAKVGMMKQAERVFKELTASGVGPDAACYRTMLGGYLNGGYVEEGISLFEQIKECVGLDRFVWSVGVLLYRITGMKQKAEGALSIMSSHGISLIENLEVGSKLKTSSSL
ncbi:pentatricopeptide repeat-containing protein At5g27270 isoform X1 [Punica granatum]|uniref:Pentatricopeptide repeat-containing protein At5g27270 isoform X1 n=1 Tax=Punica granatum TaxID=22663 RepID=A0A6P8DEP0_PUNGR|nr:pentatricopeptide repeat-containing protein At5g27270 isoform X1 [Punica granatum]